MGGLIFDFICFTAIAKVAGNSLTISAAIAGKRGLYSYIFLSLFFMIALIFSGKITLADTFEKFLYFFLSGQIVTALFAVTFDLFATLGRKDYQKK